MTPDDQEAKKIHPADVLGIVNVGVCVLGIILCIAGQWTVGLMLAWGGIGLLFVTIPVAWAWKSLTDPYEQMGNEKRALRQQQERERRQQELREWQEWKRKGGHP